MPELLIPRPKQNSLSRSVRLEDLAVGESARIVQLSGNGHDVARLAEMGLRRGAEVAVMRNGITCILQLGASRLCIRLSGDLTVLTTPI